MIHEASEGLGFLAHQNNREAKEQRGHNDLQHRGIGKGLDDITGEDIHDRLHDGGGFLGLVGQVRDGQHREQAPEGVGDRQADGDGNGRGAGIIDEGFYTHAADLLDVLHRDHAADDGEEDDGHHDELDEVQEDGAEGLDVVHRQLRGREEAHPGDDAKGQTQEDLGGQRQRFEFLHRVRFLSDSDLLSFFFLSHRETQKPGTQGLGARPFRSAPIRLLSIAIY